MIHFRVFEKMELAGIDVSYRFLFVPQVCPVSAGGSGPHSHQVHGALLSDQHGGRGGPRHEHILQVTALLPPRYS